MTKAGQRDERPETLAGAMGDDWSGGMVCSELEEAVSNRTVILILRGLYFLISARYQYCWTRRQLVDCAWNFLQELGAEIDRLKQLN